MSIQALLIGIVLALLYSVGIAGIVYRLVGRQGAHCAADAAAIGAGATPFVAGLVTIALVLLLGQSPDVTYLGLHLGLAGALALLSARPIRSMGSELLGAARRSVQGVPPVWQVALRAETLMAAVLALLLSWIAYLVVVVPLIGNDPLEYATVAKVLYARRSVDAYPLIEADPATGMFAPWTHPPLYVALIFLAYLLQGGGDLPGLMRLIPFYCLCALLLLLSRIAHQAQPGAPGRKLALLTAIFVLATPLIRFIIVEGAIDALPILGLTLVFASASLFSNAPLATRVGLTGTALGISLWAHSSAILFPVLAVIGIATMRRLQRMRFAVECVAVVLLGGALGSAPYLRNWLIFGSPISDNPAVFALQKLDWDSYFTLGRGMASTYDMIAVGVLRGWTAYSDFWLTFWFMSAGIVLVAREALRRRDIEQGQAMLVGAVSMVVAFHAGMLASVLLGSSLMVKNARYLLSIVPLVALLAGYVLVRVADLRDLIQVRWTDAQVEAAFRFGDGWRVHLVMQTLVLAVPLLAARDLTTSMTYWRNYLGPLGESLKEPQRATLARFPFYRVQEYMREALPPEALVFSLRPADMYYGKHRMLSYLDPRLVPIYSESDPAGVAELLRELGVTHIHKPNYSLPVVYNSALMQLLADERLSRLVHSDGYYAVFALAQAPGERAQPSRTWDLTPVNYPWTGLAEAQVPFLGSACRTADIRIDSAAAQATVRRCRWAPSHRAVYVSGIAPPHNTDLKHFIEVEPGQLYRYAVDAAGSGTIRMIVYEKRGPLLEVTQVDDGIVTGASRTFSGVFMVPANVAHIRFALWTEGPGELSIRNVRLEALGLPDPARGLHRSQASHQRRELPITEHQRKSP